MILFAKAPVPGRVKTRLEPLLGPVCAADLHAAFVRDMLAKIRAFRDLADMELHTDISTDAWVDASVAHKLQIEGDLGLKMLHALQVALRAGHPKAMIIGSDAPTLPPSYLHRLLLSAADVAFGPCEDGGYYAIACRKTHAEMFRGVEWSSPFTLEQSRRAAEACGLTVETGDSWFDVDEPKDLKRLLRTADLPPHCACWTNRTPLL